MEVFRFKAERREPIISTTVRIGIAIFLVFCVLIVVLIACLPPSLMPSTFVTTTTATTTATTTITTTTSTPPPRRVLPFPTSERQENVVLNGPGVTYVLSASADVNTIVITDSATLTVADTGQPIQLRTKHILIENGGGLVIGSETAPHASPLEIVLKGRLDDEQNDYKPVEVFGRKFIGVLPTGRVEIHGPWKLAWTYLTTTITSGLVNPIITLEDNASTWNIGDKIVIASSDYDMNEAEVFSILPCDICTVFQVKLNGTVMYRHLGDITPAGVDLRAEVGLLTRNIKIRGEMEPKCYIEHLCYYFSYDTFGGSFQVMRGAASAHIEGVELYNMGQQVLGRYPIHFHRVYEVYGFYARQLSIHDSFSRCVTLHSSIGLLVEDVVGYNTHGHCFFFEDGNEQDNRLIHNLGLGTKYGSLLPSDRDAVMCMDMRQTNSYAPSVKTECAHTATFWISHPNNTFINNSAAGSQEVGYLFAFYREPTGPSAGTLPPFHGERSALKEFVGNRAHSNRRAGFLLDSGVKTTQPSSGDPRDFLSLINSERFAPHVDQNLTLPRVPAIITNYTAYKNGLGLFVRGGDIWIANSTFSDNDVAVVMASSAGLPYDPGSHQQLLTSVIVGTSLNDTSWLSRDVPCVGVQVRDGPILIENNWFHNFTRVEGQRLSHAVGFLTNTSGHSSPANSFGWNYFDNQSERIFVERVDEFSRDDDDDDDDDLSQILHDRNGSLTGTSGLYVLRTDNLLLNVPEFCRQSTLLDSGVVACNGSYGQLFVNMPTTSRRLIVRVDNSSTLSMSLKGVKVQADNPTVAVTSSQFQPVLMANQTYWLSLSGTKRMPPKVELSIYNFRQHSYLTLVLSYPKLAQTRFNVTHEVSNQLTGDVVSVFAVDEYDELVAFENAVNVNAFYWQPSQGYLFIRLVSSWPQNTKDPYNYCPMDGCHVFNISYS